MVPNPRKCDPFRLCLARVRSTSECPGADSVHADGAGWVQDTHLVPKMYAVCPEDINLTLPSTWVLPIHWSTTQLTINATPRQ